MYLLLLPLTATDCIQRVTGIIHSADVLLTENFLGILMAITEIKYLSEERNFLLSKDSL